MKPLIITDTSYKELLSIAEEQYLIAEKIYWLYQEKLDFDVYDLYIAQLAVYALQIQKIRLTDPQYIELKLKDVLAEANQLWPEHGNERITAELVAKVALLLDTATALGWKEPLPEISVYSCEVCGFKGHLGVDIVERPFFDRVQQRDSTRWECKNIEKCLDRIGW
jgi:hypothetical protein